MKTLGEKIAQLRREKKLTQQEFADRMSVSRQALMVTMTSDFTLRRIDARGPPPAARSTISVCPAARPRTNSKPLCSENAAPVSSSPAAIKRLFFIQYLSEKLIVAPTYTTKTSNSRIASH